MFGVCNWVKSKGGIADGKVGIKFDSERGEKKLVWEVHGHNGGQMPLFDLCMTSWIVWRFAGVLKNENDDRCLSEFNNDGIAEKENNEFGIGVGRAVAAVVTIGCGLEFSIRQFTLAISPFWAITWSLECFLHLALSRLKVLSITFGLNCIIDFHVVNLYHYLFSLFG